MKPELFTTFETSRRLKEAGFEQDTWVSWTQHKYWNGQGYDIDWKLHSTIQTSVPQIAAPTLQEILTKDSMYYLSLTQVEAIFRHRNPAEAAAQLWLKLREVKA